MKTLLCKIALIFLVCQAENVIAQENCSIHGSKCFHYSERQDIRCLDCLMNEPCKNELIILKDSIITRQQMFIESTDSAIKTLDAELIKTKLALVDMTKKRKNAFILGGATSLGAIILTFFLVR